MRMITKENFTTPLLMWYDKNKRDLPWRKTSNPYHVWISEIMLQQTRVEAVIPYFKKFLDKYPTIRSLAQANIDDLYKIWQGLGYYRRVVNMQVGAKQIMDDYHGIFPTTSKEIMKIKGIGEYTASAIASICFGEATPAVDGNLLRIYSRVWDYDHNILTSIAKKECYSTLLPLMGDRAGDFNQALMDLGATICLPNAKPKCDLCPLKSICKGQEKWETLPVRISKTVKKEYLYTIFILKEKDKVAVLKRHEKSVLQGMDSFPMTDGQLAVQDSIQYVEKQYGKVKNIEQSFHEKHVFTHQIWHMLVYVMEIVAKNKTMLKDIKDTALPTAYQKCYERYKNLSFDY